ncbi:hypothetical protein J2W56_002504 [Nocardia kruczakiae]|uniref:Uncharacterized protein n=1 Tax=Nocardia kruczakiae TaxID=261477 RepID=A0ABU1XE01_9NOCA|nr:hypothetical protein [Nocardia kruczakiae]MDR7168773.1 hypothetical protein [Nocardia kruczakiae]
MSNPRTTAGRGCSGQPNPVAGVAFAVVAPQFTATIAAPRRSADIQRMRPTLAGTEGHGKIGFGVCGQLGSM